MTTTKQAFRTIDNMCRERFGIDPSIDKEDLPPEVIKMEQFGCWNYMMYVSSGYQTTHALVMAECAIEALIRIQKNSKSH